MSELFTSGSVGGAAGNCCSYPATRPSKHGFGARLGLPQRYLWARDWGALGAGDNLQFVSPEA